MKTWKKIAAAVIAGAMMIPAFACSHGTSTTDSKSESSSAEGSSGAESGADSGDTPDITVQTDEQGMIQQPLDFADVPPESNAGGEEQPGDNFIVTTLRGEDGKAYVAKTDINGTTVTEEGGAAVTELYTGTTLATTYAEASYTPAYKNHQAFFLDMSKKADFVFDGELLQYQIEIPKDAKDGIYPIQFYYSDIANWAADTIKDVTMNVGYVCINKDAPANDQPTGSGITINPGTVSAKPGDTVILPVSVVNNPGFVGFRLRMRYDSNAMTIVNAGAGKDLHSNAGMTAREMGDA